MMKYTSAAFAAVAGVSAIQLGQPASSGSGNDTIKKLVESSCVPTDGLCWTKEEVVQGVVQFEYCASRDQKIKVDMDLDALKHKNRQICYNVDIGVCKTNNFDITPAGVKKCEKEQHGGRFGCHVVSWTITGKYVDYINALKQMFKIIYDTTGVSQVESVIRLKTLEPLSFAQTLEQLKGSCVLSKPHEQPEPAVPSIGVVSTPRLAMFHCQKAKQACWHEETLVDATVELILCIEPCFDDQYRIVVKDLLNAHYGDMIKPSASKNKYVVSSKGKDSKKEMTFGRFWMEFMPLQIGLVHNAFHLAEANFLIRLKTQKVLTNTESLAEFLRLYKAKEGKGPSAAPAAPMPPAPGA